MTMTTTTTTMTNDQQLTTVDDRRWVTMLDTTMDNGRTFGQLTLGRSDGRWSMLGWSTMDGRQLTTDNARMVDARTVDA